MLYITRTLTAFPSVITCSSPHCHFHSLVVIKSNSNSGDGSDVAGGNSMNTSISPPSVPSEPIEIRFKRGSRRRIKQEQDADKRPLKPASVPKDWDSMTLTEKAIELYVGEKGTLFWLWLNKFAYTSIYIVIGGWILFRFVGPALNLYQLDTPPLSPTSIFK